MKIYCSLLLLFFSLALSFGAGEENLQRYMWYPGQLSAHLQQLRLKESAERCVNVGYPGKFFKPENSAIFIKTYKNSSPIEVSWKSTGISSARLNGKVVSGNSVLLGRGENELEISVDCKNSLPALCAYINGKPDSECWRVKLPSSSWHNAEFSSTYGANGKLPLDDVEKTISYSPKSIDFFGGAEKLGDCGISTGDGGGSAIVDFYALEVGVLSFSASGEGNVCVSVGESPEEAANADSKKFEQFAISPFAVSKEVKKFSLPERALRYVKFSCNKKCKITNIKFDAKVWPKEPLMSFSCSNEKINRIWNASVASLRSCMHGFYLDGIKRDYLPWAMDAVVSAIAADYVFGDRQTTLNSLSIALLPLNPTTDDLGIPDYPLHALIGFEHYLKRYDDFRSVENYRDRIEQLLNFYEKLQDKNGFISASVGKSGWKFVPSWSVGQGPDCAGTPAYVQMLLYKNFLIGSCFAARWGDKDSSLRWRKKAEALKRNIMRCFWDDTRGVFINGYHKDGSIDSGISHHAQYWAILCNLVPAGKTDALFLRMAKIPGYRDSVSFEKGYDMLSYAKERKVSLMWDYILDVYFPWLAEGNTRFPENITRTDSRLKKLSFYGRDYGLSLCHGAHGVPGVVGVLYGIAGFEHSDAKEYSYILKPDLMDLDWADISFPVKEGIIKLSLKRRLPPKVEIPNGCRVALVSPDGGKVILENK